MNSHQVDDASFSAFKKAQIQHRRQGNNPNRCDDLTEVVDFSKGDDARISSIHFPNNLQKPEEAYKGPIFGLKGFPGFLYFPQALSESLQTQIALRAVKEFCESPHRTNIDLCLPKESEDPNHGDSMWELWQSSNKDKVPLKRPKVSPFNRTKYRSFNKLSWATMGYHYDWTKRTYDNVAQSPMPRFLCDLSKMFASISLAHEGISKSELRFEPEASIVNYYNLKSLMGGHRDELEMALDKPVVSLSTGLPAIFLLGGKSKEDEPVVPILVRPGDVMCLGGDARLNYHAMARVLPPTVVLAKVEETHCPSKDQQVSPAMLFPRGSLPESVVSAEEKIALDEYLSEHRININVRQVYPDTLEDVASSAT